MSLNDRIQVEHARLQHLAPAEGEELPGERGGPLARLLDLLGVTPEALVLLAGDEELGVAADRGQEVVEVVCDAAREPADRLHLLRLAEL